MYGCKQYSTTGNLNRLIKNIWFSAPCMKSEIIIVDWFAINNWNFCYTPQLDIWSFVLIKQTEVCMLNDNKGIQCRVQLDEYIQSADNTLMCFPDRAA